VCGLVSLLGVGVFQGGSLSLLIGNIYLFCFDGKFEGVGCVFVRYVDGCSIFVGSVCRVVGDEFVWCVFWVGETVHKLYFLCFGVNGRRKTVRFLFFWDLC
jgi:hypothetical protein